MKSGTRPPLRALPARAEGFRTEMGAFGSGGTAHRGTAPHGRVSLAEQVQVSPPPSPPSHGLGGRGELPLPWGGQAAGGPQGLRGWVGEGGEGKAGPWHRGCGRGGSSTSPGSSCGVRLRRGGGGNRFLPPERGGGTKRGPPRYTFRSGTGGSGPWLILARAASGPRGSLAEDPGGGSIPPAPRGLSCPARFPLSPFSLVLSTSDQTATPVTKP